jgi:hypothetical protein
MKRTVAAAFLLILPVLSASEAFGDTLGCSTEVFAAYGQTWSGIPVMANAMLVQPSIDKASCGYVAQAKLVSVENWYKQQLADAGWRLAGRENGGELTALSFRRGDETFKLILQPSYGATIVIMERPEPNKTMEPTR